MRPQSRSCFFDEAERGVRVSEEAWLGDEGDMLKEIQFGDDLVTIITNHHQFELDLRKVDNKEIKHARVILRKMNFDNRYHIPLIYTFAGI